MGWRRKLTKFSMLQFGLTLAGRPQKARYGSSHYLSPTSVRRSSDAARGMANALEALAKARLWLDGLIVGRFTSTAEIARHERCSERAVRITLSLAFLAPAVVRAAVEGRLPYGLNTSSFSELPILWEEQLQIAS